jgi:hypothetical protein
VAVLSGCSEAEHLNPLDPLSPDFENVGVLEGRVTDRGFVPLPGVEVRLEPLGATTQTAADGTFSFGGVAPGDYTLSLSGSGLEPAAEAVTVELGKVLSGAYTLNALPTVGGVSLTTVHVSRWWPQEDLYRLDASATASDPDGLSDVAGVRLSIALLSMEFALQPTLEPGVFALSLTEADLGATLHSLLGRDLTITVSDQVDAALVAGPYFLSRIIDIIPETAEPSGSQEVPGGSPLLTWPPVVIPFDHTFQIDVYRVDENVSTNVHSADDIEPGVLSFQVADTFATGTYYWTLSIVDEFGNRSRSKEAGFLVP